MYRGYKNYRVLRNYVRLLTVGPSVNPSPCRAVRILVLLHPRRRKAASQEARLPRRLESPPECPAWFLPLALRFPAASLVLVLLLDRNAIPVARSGPILNDFSKLTFAT